MASRLMRKCSWSWSSSSSFRLEAPSRARPRTAPGAVTAVICDVLEAEASDQAGLASRVANVRPAADEMATRIADMLMHMGGD